MRLSHISATMNEVRENLERFQQRRGRWVSERNNLSKTLALNELICKLSSISRTPREKYTRASRSYSLNYFSGATRNDANLLPHHEQ